ncbi:MAG: ABC transporter substrate-binding protein, partial [Eubacteriales bacterium]|nr:ABC transporter substrate-binding protein [Eubacteriales bacterium]
MSALLGGCTGDDAGSGGESAQSQASASSSVSASAAASAAAVSASNYSPPAAITYPADVTDGLGVSMTIKSKPSAIISLSLGTDEMLLAIADHSSVKAVSGAISEDAKISNIAEEAKNFPKAASNSENIISLKPDLVIANDWTSSELVNQLRDAGITVYSYITPTDIDGQIKVISDLASVIGEAVKGGAVIDEMNRVLESTSEKLKALKEEDKATVLSYNLYGSTNGKGTSFDDIVTRAGLINAAAAADLDPYAQISKEKIIEMNPDILFLPDITYEINTDPETFAESIRNDPSLAAVNAVKNGRIYLLPDKHMTSTSQYMAYGVEDAAKAAYPELFK